MDYSKDLILYRLFSRKILIDIGGLEYEIKPPTSNLRYLAELYKERIINKYKYDLPSLEPYLDYIVARGLIERDYKKKIDTMHTTIRRLKKELYQSGPKIEQAKQIKKTLNIVRTNFNKYINNVEFYKQPTLEYFADNEKNRFLLTNTTYLDNQLVFNSDNIDVSILQVIITRLNEAEIPVSNFREIARTDPWRDYWLSNKYNIFGIPAVEYSEDQKSLCMWSRMYDNYWEHPESTIDIVDDDDKVDGFFIFHQEKNKESQKQVLGAEIPENYQEVFVSAASQEEANLIYQANNPNAKRILKERAMVLKQNADKEINDLAFKDVRLDTMAQAAEQESQIMKNRGR